MRLALATSCPFATAATLNAWNSFVKTMRFVFLLFRANVDEATRTLGNKLHRTQMSILRANINTSDQDFTSRVAHLVRWNGHDTKRYIINYVIWLFWLCCHKWNARAINILTRGNVLLPRWQTAFKKFKIFSALRWRLERSGGKIESSKKTIVTNSFMSFFIWLQRHEIWKKH